jgi:hypothetical protein
MSIRIGLYDFFAHTIPGVFYILVAAFALAVFGYIDIDAGFLGSLSIFAFLIVLGSGFVLGQLLDYVAYIWLRLVKSRNRTARQKAIEAFHQKYPWIELQLEPKEWAMFLYAIKIQMPEMAVEIEQLNAISISLRNISLGLLMTSLIFFGTFITVYTHIGNLILAVITLLLSLIALDRANLRRHWFYLGIFEVFATNYLLEENLLNARIQTNQEIHQGKTQSETIEETG